MIYHMLFAFSWRNLKTRRLRTSLGLVGLSIPVFGVLGLFSISAGLRGLVSNTLGQIQGVMVIRESAPTPVFSDLPADLAGRLRQVAGVRVVAPEILKVAPSVEGVSTLQSLSRGLWSTKDKNKGILEVTLVMGEDIEAHSQLKSAIGPKSMLPKDQGGGRYLNLSDKGQPHVVISKKIAEDHRDASGRPKRVGDTLRIGNRPFEIVGIYETKSLLLDVIIVMDIDMARQVLGVSTQTVSSFYVEAENPGKVAETIRAMEAAVPGINAKRVSEFEAPYGSILDELDTLLLLTVSLALAVGVVGIMNTMLMSTSDRFVEFGVLRANGWSRADVLALVTTESALLGLLAGLLGCLLAIAGAAAVNPFVGSGLRLSVPPQLFALGIALSVTTGLLGGLYPAWSASRLVPMDAVRLGSR
jgi:putative ABC transport system permease protein